MKIKSRKVMNYIFLLLAVNSLSISKETRDTDNSEFLILGTQYKKSDKNTGSSSNNNSDVPINGGDDSDDSNVPDDGGDDSDDSNVPDDGGDDSDDSNVPDDGGDDSDDSNVPDDGGDDSDISIAVIKENGIVKAEKEISGDKLDYEVSENIIAEDNIGLWAVDRNTNVMNKYNIESNYTDSDTMKFSAEISENAGFINNGTITGNRGGVYLYSGGMMTNNGLINNTGEYGMYISENKSVGTNNGVVSNGGMYGVYVKDGGNAVNSESGEISNTGNNGMSVDGTGSNILNSGIIKNTGQNGMYIINGGSGINRGTIINKGDYGIYVNGEGSNLVNEETGIIDNSGSYGIYLENSANGVNLGTISNSKYGIYTTSAAIAENKGDIAVTSYGMYAEDSSVIINEESGHIRAGDMYSMYITENSSGYNYGEIKSRSNTAVAIGEGATFINEESGIISAWGSYGIYASQGGYARNNGRIEGADKAVYVTMGGTFINEERGVISNSGNYGIDASKSNIENKGIIENGGNYGMIGNDGYTMNSGEIINNGSYGMVTQALNENSESLNSGLVKNNGKYGVQVLASNKKTVLFENTETGIIANKGDYGIYVSISSDGEVVNNGLIQNTGNYGIYSASGGNSEIINNGTIHLTGDNKTGVYVSNSDFTNNGVIQIDGNNATGIKAENNSIVRIGQDSQIILNGNDPITQANTDFSNPDSNTNSGGKAYDLDATSTLINAGTIVSSGNFTVEDNGKFVLDTDTGGIEAATLNLEGDMYVNAEGTTDSSENSYVFDSINVHNVTGAGNVVSDSYLFTASMQQKTDDYSIILERKNFGDVFKGELGNVLEKNYLGSENNSEQNKLYNSLKKNVTSEAKAKTAEQEITGASLTANLAYQQFEQNKMLEDGIFELLDRKSNVDHGLYLNFLGGKTKADTKENALGFDEDSYGFTAGIMKKVGESTSIGGFVGYLDSDIDYKDSGESNQSTNTWTVKGALEQEITDKLVWTSTLGYNISSTDTKRKITYDNSNKEVKGDFDSWSVNGRTELKYTYDITDRINLKPMLGISLDYLSQDGYSEKGIGYNLNVDSADALFSETGGGLGVGNIAV
ncbi:autotransporter domain-containing protein [Sebaldella sp. S0638]|uniref:autotransporter family protein n=1 Tax=Sebaldella sp. S0638 TaxID=2957809 RepID=UPI0020A0C51A|nr:autotransporter domain-containing protein [Sebaldella sp. S0638]MCP1226278.1 autotransporter domain-containing protein [Sebaldella sp. S0638]